MDTSENNLLIAACGMNCGVCMAYLREKNHCPGCRAINDPKAVSRMRCVIKNCDRLQDGFCTGCDVFPCARLKQLDKRYRTKYHMSMIENLENIGKYGITAFTASEKKRWTCPDCNGTICVHRGRCVSCGKIVFN